MIPVQQSRGQTELEAPWLGMRAAAGSVITFGDVITHLRRAISELLVPTPVLSGTHCSQRLERFINWFNDALPLFQKDFCLRLHGATKSSEGATMACHGTGQSVQTAHPSRPFHTHDLFNLLLWKQKQKQNRGIYPSPSLSKLVRTSPKLNKLEIRF